MKIYITKGVQQIGPFSEEEIRGQLESGNAKDTDLAWCEGRSDWVPLSQILSASPAPGAPAPSGEQHSDEIFPDARLADPQQDPIATATVVKEDLTQTAPSELEQQKNKNMKWYYSDGNTQVGPVNQSEIVGLAQSGKIKRSTQVWKEGTPSWCEAGFTELVSHLAPEPPPMNLPPPQNNATQPPIMPPLVGNSIVQPRNPPRSIGWMTFWAVMWPGLGQLLCGQKSKGVVLMITSMFLNFISAGLLSIPFCVIGGIDAYKVARTLACGKPVQEWEFFPNP